MLAISKGYPWRASLLNKARCATCQYHYLSGDTGFECKKKHILQYPTYSKTHDCPDFKFKPNPPPEPDENELLFSECSKCGYNFMSRCDGIRWRPIGKKDSKCEFFRPKYLICKNAIPYLQYCNHLRNNYCKLPPHKREGDMKRGWSWNCPYAHKDYADGLHCYKPKKVSVSDV